MRVVHLSFHDRYGGGAGRAADRLHLGLQRAGIDSLMLVSRLQVEDPTVFGPATKAGHIASLVRPRLDRALALSRPRHKYPFWSPNQLPAPGLLNRIRAMRPDVVHLHWVAGGFLPVRLIARMPAPVVWTLHDMWPFAGGHGYLPDEDHTWHAAFKDMPRSGERRFHLCMHKAIETARPHFVSSSQYLASLAKQSPLLHNASITVIASSVDTDRFTPWPREQARRMLSLPVDRKLILFAAMRATDDPRKGFGYLQKAIERGLNDAEDTDQTDVVLLGGLRRPASRLGAHNVHHLGVLRDMTSLALAFAAADVFICPSLQDNLPNTVMEALACGTPVVAFAVGGIPEMVDHKKTGYLARPRDVESLITGIRWVLRHPDWRALSDTARATAMERFALDVQAQQTIGLYHKLLNTLSVCSTYAGAKTISVPTIL